MLNPARPYWDLAVYQTSAAEQLSPTFCLLTDRVASIPSPSNRLGQDPQLLASYFNVYDATSKGSAPLGNFVVANFSPTGIQGNYGIAPTSPAVASGSVIPPGTPTDFAGNPRSSLVDIGALQATSTFQPGRALSRQFRGPTSFRSNP